MKLVYLAGIFLSIASGLAGLISFFAAHKKDPSNRKKFFLTTGIVFVVSLGITIATWFLDRERHDDKNSGVYIANGSESRRIYFHSDADAAFRRDAFINSETEVYVREIRNGFGYVEFRNTKGQTSKGWLEMKYLVAKP